MGAMDPKDNSAMRARVAGKMAVEARTAWALDIGGGMHRLRCLRDEHGDGFTVQMRTSKGWTQEVTKGTDAHALLCKVVGSKAIAALFKSATEDPAR